MTGCATGYRVDSDVRAFSQLSARPAEARYRFERLPSQQTDAAGQARLESVAAPALARVGLRQDDGGSAAAQYAVNVTARAQRLLADPFDAWGPWGGFGGFGGFGGWYGGRGHFGQGVWAQSGPYGRGLGGFHGWGSLPPQTLVQREVALTLRELASGRVVYETHAVHDGAPRNDDSATLAAMFEAALRDFPQAAAGRQRVDVLPVAPVSGAAPVPVPAAAPASAPVR